MQENEIERRKERERERERDIEACVLIRGRDFVRREKGGNLHSDVELALPKKDNQEKTIYTKETNVFPNLKEGLRVLSEFYIEVIHKRRRPHSEIESDLSTWVVYAFPV